MLSPINAMDGPVHAVPMPDPEVPGRSRRRSFAAAHDLAVLREIDAATEPGAVGAILGRERSCSSHLAVMEALTLVRVEGMSGQVTALLERVAPVRCRPRSPC